MARDERWGRTYESFGEDPAIASMMTSYIDGLQGDDPSAPNTILATAKHWVGDGGTAGGIDHADFGAENLTGRLRPMRGKDRIFTLLDFLENAQRGNETRMDICFRKYVLTVTHPGVAIIISDFLTERAIYEEGLKALIYKDFDVNVIHVLSEEELHPTLSGELKLQDAETGGTKEITITDRMLERYQRRLADFCQDLDSFCTSNNVTYVQVNTALPFEDLMLGTLRRERVLL